MDRSTNLIPIKEVGGVQIYLNDKTGKFQASLGSPPSLVQRKDLRALEREITSRSAVLMQVLQISEYSIDGASVVDVVRAETNANEGLVWRTTSGRLVDDWRVRAYSADAAAKIAAFRTERDALNAQRSDLDDRWKVFAQTLPRVTLPAPTTNRAEES